MLEKLKELHKNGVKKEGVKEINILTTDQISTPCFVCRQMILELFDKTAIIRCYNTEDDLK